MNPCVLIMVRPPTFVCVANTGLVISWCPSTVFSGLGASSHVDSGAVTVDVEVRRLFIDLEEIAALAGRPVIPEDLVQTFEALTFVFKTR